MNNLNIFRIKIRRQRFQLILKLTNHNSSISINITKSKEFMRTNFPTLQNLKQLKQTSMLKRNIKMRSIHINMLFTILSISFQSILILWKRYSLGHILIKNERKPGDLTLAELEFEVLASTFEFFKGYYFFVLGVDYAEESLRG